MVFHDETLERMTDGVGAVTACSLAELKRLRLKDVAGELTAEEIPTFDEVYALVEKERVALAGSAEGRKRAAEFVVNAEIKGLGIAGFVERAIEGHLGGVWGYRNVVVSSFDLASLEEMQAANRKIPVAALFEGPLGNAHEPWDLELGELAICLKKVEHLKPQTVNITLPSLSDEAVAMIRATGAEPIGWTSGEVRPDMLPEATRRAMAEQIRRHGITLITDFPREMISLLGAY